MAEWAVGRLGEALGGLEGKRVLLLGIAYRENVKETAFSGAVRIIDILKKQQAVPLLSDPLYTHAELARYGGEPVTLEPLPACDAVILHAYHDAYKSLDWRALAGKSCKIVLDGRNSLDREAIESAGMRYIGIGR
jgi:UDP-N-acetyl-D-mannosaminuronate dehydrogenase